jgi:hypothetical protein
MGHHQGDGNSLQHLPSCFFVSQPASSFSRERAGLTKTPTRTGVSRGRALKFFYKVSSFLGTCLFHRGGFSQPRSIF